MPGAYSGNITYLTSILQRHSLEVSVVGISTKIMDEQANRKIVIGDGLVAQAKGALEAIRKAREIRPGAVIITQAGSMFTAALSLALRAIGTRVIYFCADPPIEMIKLRALNSAIKWLLVWWLRLSQPIIDRFVDSTLSVSPGLDALMRNTGWKGKIRRFYNVHHTNIHGRAEESNFRRNLRWEDDVVVVYAGAYQKNFRGIEHQLRAVALARSMGASIKFLGIGYFEAAYYYPDYFPDLAKSLGLEHHSAFYASQDAQTLSHYLADSDAAVSNSLPWALPSKIFEYINNGVEIISIQGDNDVNKLCDGFVTLYDGSTEDLARALMGIKRRNLNQRKFKGPAFCQALRLESEYSVGQALTDLGLTRKSVS